MIIEHSDPHPPGPPGHLLQHPALRDLRGSPEPDGCEARREVGGLLVSLRGEESTAHMVNGEQEEAADLAAVPVRSQKVPGEGGGVLGGGARGLDTECC